jgi:hypothetical protein
MKHRTVQYSYQNRLKVGPHVQELGKLKIQRLANPWHGRAHIYYQITKWIDVHHPSYRRILHAFSDVDCRSQRGGSMRANLLLVSAA